MAIQPKFLMERQGKTFALYAGLLDAAHGEGLKGIRTTLLQVPNDDNGHVAIVHAVVVTDKGEFAGLGDASPLNVARPMVTCLIRMAECVPLDTRILTATGWKFHHELTIGELVLAYDLAADCCRWTPLVDVSVYDGAWEAVRLSSRSFQAICTPNHTWAVTSQHGAPRLKRTCDLNPSDKIITAAPCLDGSHPLTPQESAILGWLATDGTVRESYVGRHGPYRRMVIRQSKPEQVERIRELVGVNAAEYVSQSYDRDFGTHVSRCLPGHTFDLRAAFGRELWQKSGLRDWSDLPQLALKLGPEAREAMLTSMLDGDGSQRGERESWTFGKKRKPGVMSTFQLLATLGGRSLGKPGVASRGDVPVQTIRVNRLVSCAYLNRETITVDGVWCPTTEFGTWVMEHNGHITITGNTRAKARALRDAVNVGVASVEELGADDADDDHKPRHAPRREDVDFVQTRQPRQSPRRAEAAVAQMADTDAASTPAQHRAIAQIGGSVHGWDNAAIEQYTTERFGRRLVELTKGQASQIIQALQQQGAARAG